MQGEGTESRRGEGGTQEDEERCEDAVAGLRGRDRDDAVRNARLAAGRRSLLNNDGSLTTWLRAGSSFAGAAKSLLG